MRKTPLEKACEREEGKISSCCGCENIVGAGGWYYCKISGKLLHPFMLEYRPDFRCKRRKNIAQID